MVYIPTRSTRRTGSIFLSRVPCLKVLLLFSCVAPTAAASHLSGVCTPPHFEERRTPRSARRVFPETPLLSFVVDRLFIFARLAHPVEVRLFLYWPFLFLHKYTFTDSGFVFLSLPLSTTMATPNTANSARVSSPSKSRGDSGTLSLCGHIYLCLYNTAAFVAWAYVFYLFLHHCLEKRSWLMASGASALYRRLEWPLVIAQSMQIMEIIHAMIGLVRSGVLTTFIQVRKSGPVPPSSFQLTAPVSVSQSRVLSTISGALSNRCCLLAYACLLPPSSPGTSSSSLLFLWRLRLPYLSFFLTVCPYAHAASLLHAVTRI